MANLTAGVLGRKLAPDSGTTVLAEYADQFYAGTPAAVTRSLGKGTVTYIGVDSLNGDLEADLLRGVFKRAGVTVALADGFFVDWRDGFWVATNFSAQDQPAPIPANAKILIGSRDVPTAGVTVWQE